ncbi:MAG TPA: 7-cyano-7-deazaguanine synthase, partial [Chthoniobacteraceae bacterium]|nr:7-cyano-7-deazaguanine synthase [Chthoniobacteraceae bacterium]
SFTVENPFLWMTKADVVEKIVKASCGELIAASTSCAHTWERTKEYTHCGTCSQCIDRRLAIASVGAERFDPAKHYRRNIFVADRPADDDKMMLAAYLARADELNKISDIAGFIEIFPEIVGAFPFIPGGANKVASQLFDLYKRHGREVNIALTSTIKSYSNYLVDGTLGGGCLLWTLVRKGESNSVSKSPAKLESNHVLYRGADWVITYNGLDVSVKNILGMHYLAFLLRHPGTEVSHSDIYSAVFPPDDPTAVTEILKSGITKGIPMVDTKTIEDVKSAIPDCLAKKDAMQSAGNFKGVEILEEQIDRLQNYLAAVCKKGGGSRVVKGRHQAMRVSVLNALKLAKKKIGATERGRTLLDHLKSSIQPGSPGHLVYKPPQSVDWTFEIPTKNGL